VLGFDIMIFFSFPSAELKRERAGGVDQALESVGFHALVLLVAELPLPYALSSFFAELMNQREFG